MTREKESVEGCISKVKGENFLQFFFLEGFEVISSRLLLLLLVNCNPYHYSYDSYENSNEVSERVITCHHISSYLFHSHDSYESGNEVSEQIISSTHTIHSHPKISLFMDKIIDILNSTYPTIVGYVAITFTRFFTF